jgi:hypothetical protein
MLISYNICVKQTDSSIQIRKAVCIMCTTLKLKRQRINKTGKLISGRTDRRILIGAYFQY